MYDVTLHPELEVVRGKYLRCYFDEMGLNHFILQDYNNEKENWKYETPLGIPLPQKKQ